MIETNEMPELTERTRRAGASGSDSRLHAVYMASQPLSGCIAGIRKARRAARPHIVCNDLTPTAKRYLRDGTVDFVDRSDLLAGVVPRGVGDVSNAAARREAEA